MPATPFDSAHLTRLFATGDTARLFSDSAEIRAMMLVEAALAQAQAAQGVIPETAAAAIQRASVECQIDPAQLAEATGQNGVVVPAFVGLGAPHWDPYARGAILGITRGTQAGHLARAAVESMAFQTRDVLDAMTDDAELDLAALRVDGGASVNDDLMQFQADLLSAVVRRPVVSETTALGVAYLAGLAVGYWQDVNDISSNWVLDREFVPEMDAAERDRRYAIWQEAVKRASHWEQPG